MSQPRARPKSLPGLFASEGLETMLADLGGEIVVLADGLQKTVRPATATLLSQMHEFRRRRRWGARRIFTDPHFRCEHDQDFALRLLDAQQC